MLHFLLYVININCSLWSYDILVCSQIVCISLWSRYKLCRICHCYCSDVVFVVHDVVCFFVQATIGIDFLSKTMYLDDRTVHFFLFV